MTFSVSDQSPCTLGILIKRELCQLIIGDLSGTILDSITYTYESLGNAMELLDLLYEGYLLLQSRTRRKLRLSAFLPSDQSILPKGSF